MIPAHEHPYAKFIIPSQHPGIKQRIAVCGFLQSTPTGTPYPEDAIAAEPKARAVAAVMRMTTAVTGTTTNSNRKSLQPKKASTSNATNPAKRFCNLHQAASCQHFAVPSYLLRIVIWSQGYSQTWRYNWMCS